MLDLFTDGKGRGAKKMAEPSRDWTFFREIEIPEDMASWLVPGETALGCYSTDKKGNNAAVVTDRRAVIKNIESGFGGTKHETFSFAWDFVQAWSFETAGIAGIDSELEFWAPAFHFKLKISREIDAAAIAGALNGILMGR